MSKKRFISLILFFIILSTSLVPLKPVQAEGSKKIEVGNSVQEGLSKEKEKELLGKLEKVKKELEEEKEKYDIKLRKFSRDYKSILESEKNSYLKKLDIKDSIEGKTYSVTVSKDGDIKTIQEALDMASGDENLNLIEIEEGNYKESDLLLIRRSTPITIEGKGKVLINGNIICSSLDNDLPKVTIKNITFDGQNNTSEILDKNIGIGGGNVNLSLENLDIKNYENSIVIDSAKSNSRLELKDSHIHKNISDLVILNTSALISGLNYEDNNGGLTFFNDKELELYQDLTLDISESKFISNEISSVDYGRSLFNLDLGYANLDNLLIKDNSVQEFDLDLNSLFFLSDLYTRDSLSSFKLSNSKLEGNRGGLSSKFNCFIVDTGVDLNISNIDLKENTMNHNIIFDSNISLKNVEQSKENKSRGIQCYIENNGLGEKLSIENVDIYNNDEKEIFSESLIIGTEIDFKNLLIDSHDGEKESTTIIKDSLMNLENVNFEKSGNILIRISGLENHPNKVNSINKLSLKVKDSKISAENKLDIFTEGGIYQFEDVEIKKESFNNNSIINLKSDLLGYKDIVLENTGPFITDLSSRSAKEKSLNQLFMENIKINNKITSNQNHNMIPLAILGEGDLDLQLKDISITGEGNIVEYLYLDNLGKVDLYQLKGLGHNIFSALNYDNIKELNFYNSTIDNRNLVLSAYPNIDLNRSQINMYNTIFLTEGLKRKVINNSKVVFKNSNLLDDLSQFDENFINDDTNIFGEPELDDIGYPKEGSIVIDKGNNDYAKDLIKDLAGKDRIVNDIVDLGVYEYNPEDLIDPENPPVDPPIDPEKPPIEPEKPIDPEDPPVDPDPLPVDPPEIKGEHRFYIDGFKDSSLRPSTNITRHESAIVLYRILKEKIIEENYKEEADFKDIGPNYWGQDYIATLSNLGIIKGKPNGNFSPQEDITRAEFAKLLYEFDQVQKNEFKERKKDFTDIKGHWAEKYIKEMARKGWIEGYVDGSFRPDQPISRIEVILMVNKILNRKVDLENTLDGVKEFTDVDKNHRYYTDILEATNSHEYKIEKGKEIWTKLK